MDIIQNYLNDPHCFPPGEIEQYLNGECDLFAIAVHRLTNAEIWALTETRLITSNNGQSTKTNFALGLVHAVCCRPNSQLKVFDAKGWRSGKQVISEYGYNLNFHFSQYSEKELIELVHPNCSLNEERLTKAIEFVKEHYIQHF